MNFYTTDLFSLKIVLNFVFPSDLGINEVDLIEPTLRVIGPLLTGPYPAWCRRRAVPSVFCFCPTSLAIPFMAFPLFPPCPSCFRSSPQLGLLFPSMCWGIQEPWQGCQRCHNLKYVWAPGSMLTRSIALIWTRLTNDGSWRRGVAGERRCC